MIDDKDILIVDEPSLTAGERLYLPQILAGMRTTIRHLFKTLFGRPMTVQYPEEQRELRVENYRGVHRLNRDEQGRVACVACYMCETACPAHCIHIDAGDSPWEDREKYPVKFDLDELRCIYCGMCEEACPVDDPASPGKRASSMRRASAMPTALPTPCPRGPVVASTPTVCPNSGWPGVRLSHWRKRWISDSGSS